MELPKAHNPICCLSWGYVAVDNRPAPSMVRIHLQRSKCNQLGRGVDMVIGGTGMSLCPVAVIVDYIHVCHDPPGVFFRLRNGTPGSKSWFISRIRSILSYVGLPRHEYAGHSFRIGAATTAAMVAIKDSTIQALGSWQSTAFIHTPQDRLAAILQRLALAETCSSTSGTIPD